MNTTILPRLAVIAGPTASGKSALALRLARAAGGTIVNADALQVYRDLRVLTARPSREEEAAAPHRLFGHVDGADAHDVARWLAEATAAVEASASAGRLPIVVGGTGLHLRALTEGLAPVPPIDAEVRATVRAAAPEDNRRALEREDPVMAARLRPSDRQRIARALEVARSTGRSLSDWQAERSGGIDDRYRVLGVVVQPTPATTADRIEARLHAMFAGGAAEEVEALLRRPDVLSDAPVWRAIGARNIAGWTMGSTTREEAMATTAAASRAYAKRQRTWLRHQLSADWLRVENADDPTALAHLLTPPVRVEGGGPV